MSLQPFYADPVAPLVFCESCSWPMRLALVAPLWDNGDAETHTYECACCKHRQSFKLPLKQSFKQHRKKRKVLAGLHPNFPAWARMDARANGATSCLSE